MAYFLFCAGFAISAVVGFLYFRDLGDVSQMFLKVKRKNTIRFIRHEYKFIAVGVVALCVMIAGFAMGGGNPWLFWISLAVIAFLFLFTWVWVHVGLRNQKDKAKYYPSMLREIISIRQPVF